MERYTKQREKLLLFRYLRTILLKQAHIFIMSPAIVQETPFYLMRLGLIRQAYLSNKFSPSTEQPLSLIPRSTMRRERRNKLTSIRIKPPIERHVQLVQSEFNQFLRLAVWTSHLFSFRRFT
jgi:hypothetical protein